MSRIYLKKAQLTAKSNASEVHETVKNILADIEAGGDSKLRSTPQNLINTKGI